MTARVLPILLVVAVVLGVAPAAWAQAPANDDFADRAAVTAADSPVSGTTVEATREAGEPGSGSSSVWYSYTPAEDRWATLDVCGAGFPATIAVYTGAAVGALTPVAVHHTCDAEITFLAAAGEQYQVQVDGGQGTFDLSLGELSTPPHDDFASALEIAPGERYAASNEGATGQAGEPDHAGEPGSHSVWYRYDGFERETVMVDTCGPGADTVLAVYSATTFDLADATPETSSATGCGADPGSRVIFTAEPGRFYMVAVDGVADAEGDFALGVELVPPANDDFADAIEATGSDTFSNVAATKEPGEPKHAGGGGSSIWFDYTVPESAIVTLEAVTEFDCFEYDPVLAVYTGDAVDELAEVASNDDANGPGCDSAVQFVAHAGTVYRVAVDGYRGDTGSGELVASVDLECTVAGTDGDDELVGNPDDDVICAAGGDDVLDGRGGDDLLLGGAGSDRILDGPGNDLSDGESGSDVIVGGTGDDIYVGGSGTDRMDYSARVYGVRLNLDDCGCAGNGRFGVEDDLILDLERGDGGSGNDLLRGTGGANQLRGNDGADAIYGYDGDDVLEGGSAGDYVQADDGDDTIEPGSGPDEVLAGDGVDFVDGSRGLDTLDGGPGVDTLSYASRGAGEGVVVRLDGLRNDGADPDSSGGSTPAEEADRDKAFETAIGGAGDDRLRGGAGVNTLTGGDGDDRLDGGLGRDTLDGGDGVDAIAYSARGTGSPVAVTLDGARNDGADPNADGSSSSVEEGDLDVAIENAIGGAGGDRLTGNAGVNVLEGLGGSDRLDGRLGTDALDGGLGTDTVTYAGRGAGERVVVRLDGARNDGADPNGDGTSSAAEEGDHVEGSENVVGGDGSDNLIGAAGPNFLTGGLGDDRLDGGLGRDTLDGGGGIDTITYAFRVPAVPVAVRLDGVRNDGADPDGDGQSAAGEEADLDVDVENAAGGSGDDQLFGSDALNVLVGGRGDDLIDARDGGALADEIRCGVGTDQFGADASDTAENCETALP